jgi:hypothetical protein
MTQNDIKSLRFGEYLKRNNDPSWYENRCMISKFFFWSSFQLASIVRKATKKIKDPAKPKKDKKTAKVEPGKEQKPEKAQEKKKKYRDLQVEDLPGLGREDDIENYVISLDLLWQEELKKHKMNADYKPNFNNCVWNTFKCEIIIISLL